MAFVEESTALSATNLAGTVVHEHEVKKDKQKALNAYIAFRCKYKPGASLS